MPSKEKVKGNSFEIKVRNMFREKDIECVRAWGSDGRSLGMNEEVDVLATHKGIKYTIQCKVRKKIAQFFKPSEDIYAQVMQEDRDIPYAVVRLSDLIDLIKDKSNVEE